jgi:hypothetical protein
MQDIELARISQEVAERFYNLPGSRGLKRVIRVVLRCPRYVRSSPNSGGKADVAALLIRAISGREQSQQRRLIQSPRRRAQAAKRYGQTEHSRGLSVDNQLDLGRLHYRQAER